MQTFGMSVLAGLLLTCSTTVSAQETVGDCEQNVRDLICYNDPDVERCVQTQLQAYCPGDTYQGPQNRTFGLRLD
ncbi:hypothetical protein GCM10022600_14170 [Qipengyuania pelagi]|jgi:hypothetical protein|uniref:Uncharacterized protein n=1 Tax=Qipengyuania pelagi TaxID=994320 RepID=A0A844Y703_9SPHN|nr:hypothetical protein [Qipengyuania pelagi]MXO53721.1 hypothetical protein [Qipengyuania pelagi]